MNKINKIKEKERERSSPPHVKLQLTSGEHGCTPCHFDLSYSALGATQKLIAIDSYR